MSRPFLPCASPSFLSFSSRTHALSRSYTYSLTRPNLDLSNSSLSATVGSFSPSIRHTFIFIHALDRDLAATFEIKRHGLPHGVEIVLDDFCAGDKHTVLGEEKIRIAAAAVEDRNISCCKIVPRHCNLHSHIFVPAPLGSSSGSSRVALSIRLVISLQRKFPKGRTLLDIMPPTSILCKASSVPPAPGPAVAPRARLLCK